MLGWVGWGLSDPGARNRKVPVAPFNRTYTTNQSSGGVWRVRSWLGLGAGYFESALSASLYVHFREEERSARCCCREWAN